MEGLTISTPPRPGWAGFWLHSPPAPRGGVKIVPGNGMRAAGWVDSVALGMIEVENGSQRDTQFDLCGGGSIGGGWSRVGCGCRRGEKTKGINGK